MSENILDRIVGSKLKEIERRKATIGLGEMVARAKSSPSTINFVETIHREDQIALIAEVKKASPSHGLIREDFDPVSIAQTYAENGASCISVLTDEEFFQGRLEYLTEIKKAVEVPVLRKDFVLDPYQVFEARVAGADAVLLIAECLQPGQLAELVGLIEQLEMTALVELYEPHQLDNVLAANAQLIGINNRNLRTFEVSLQHSIEIRKLIDPAIPVVAESGIVDHSDVRRLAAANIQAILVGQSLMEQPDIGHAVRELLDR